MAVTNQILPGEPALFQRIAAGDQVAFRIVFEHYTPRIYPFIYKKVRSHALTEEIVQDIFTKIWTNRMQLGNVENHSAYIFTIAVRKVYRHFRKIISEEKLRIELWHRIQPGQNPTEEIMDEKESRQLIDQAINTLPPQRRLIYQLSRIEGLSHAAIAKQLNISSSTVNNQLTEALRHIRSFVYQKPHSSFIIMFLLMNEGR